MSLYYKIRSTLKYRIISSTAIAICLFYTVQYNSRCSWWNNILYTMQDSETGKPNTTNMAVLHIFVADQYKNRWSHFFTGLLNGMSKPSLFFERSLLQYPIGCLTTLINVNVVLLRSYKWSFEQKVYNELKRVICFTKFKIL